MNHKRVAGARPDEGARLGSKLGASSWRDDSAKRGIPRRVKQEELELMRILTMANWPEWNLDMAALRRDAAPPTRDLPRAAGAGTRRSC